MNLKHLVKGSRPKTLVAATQPILAAMALNYLHHQENNWFYVVLCLVLALCIQIATNFYNDAVDHIKGADDKRIGPARITSQDKVDVKAVFWVGHFFLAIAFLVGIPLVFKGGIIVALLGVISLFFAYGYTGGPFPLAYLGLGELFVFIFFGLVATVGSYFLISTSLHRDAWVLGSQIGLLSCVLIAINNFRDRLTDIEVGKRTLATRLSKRTYYILLALFFLLPYMGIFYYVYIYNFIFLFNFLSLPLAVFIIYKFVNARSGIDYNKLLALSGMHLLFFSVLFMGICYAN